MSLACTPVKFGLTDKIKATTAAAFGQAADVPLKRSLKFPATNPFAPTLSVVVIHTPGARTSSPVPKLLPHQPSPSQLTPSGSGLTPGFTKAGLFDERFLVSHVLLAPTAMTFWFEAYDDIEALLFPAENKTISCVEPNPFFTYFFFMFDYY